jgi:hypothetical protein
MIVFWIIILIILIAGIIIKFVPINSATNKSEKYGFGPPFDLPALNRFVSAESSIDSFWYDPTISSSEGPQTTWGMSRDDLSSSNATNLDEVFGPDSYVRYNIEDIDVAQPE